MRNSPLRPADTLFASHPRRWRHFNYVYPVISRRCRGLSIGVNLNPDAACNFDCVYCCADRTPPRPDKHVDLSILARELRSLSANWQSLFAEPEFQATPPELRRLNDIAFSGDGEPTIVPVFPEAARIAVAVRRELSLDAVRIIVITNGCGLTNPAVVDTLSLLDQNNGEIWAKLDAGTEEYFQRVNRARWPLQRVLENILSAAKLRPIVIQSLFLRLHGTPPSAQEVAAYCERLVWLLRAGGHIKLVQVYTVARRTREAYVAPLAAAELEQIAAEVRRAGLPVEVFP